MDSNDNSKKWDLEADVVIIGSGCSGLCAANVAATEGAKKVVVLEKTDQIGGATTLSGGGAWIPNNKFLRMGFKVEVWDPIKKVWNWKRIDNEEGRQMALKYVKKCSMGYSNDELIETFVDNAWKMTDYLEDNTHLKWAHTRFMPEYYPEWDGAIKAGRTIEPQLIDCKTMPVEVIETLRIMPQGFPALIDEMDKFGGLATIAYAGAWDMEMVLERSTNRIIGTGLAMIAALAWSCRDKGIDIMLETCAKRLEVEDGRVVGVIAESKGKQLKFHAKKGVVLCAGGFEWNPLFTKAFTRGPLEGPLSAPVDTGDGQRLGMMVGAQMSQMQDAWWFPTCYFPGDSYEGKPSHRTVMYEKVGPGTIWVNKYGKRFTNEGSNYRSIMRILGNYDPIKHEFSNSPTYMVLDETTHKTHMVAMTPPDEELKCPPFKKGNTIKELAENCGIDPEGLEETIKNFNKFAKEGKDPEFHRGESYYDYFYGDKIGTERGIYRNPALAPIETPPFYAIQVLPGVLGTAGGVAINKKGQVLDWDNKVIPGLYAAGNNTGCILGWGYVGGGGTIAPAMTMAYLAGKEIVKE